MATRLDNRGRTASARMAADVMADGRWLLAVGAALFAISLIALGRDVSHWTTPDLMIYRHAGQTALRSGDLYTSSFGSARFTYPPFSALMFEALSGPVTQTKWIMTGASVVALTVIGWVAAGELRGRPTVRAGTALVIAWAALWMDPVMSTFTWGQIDLVLLAVTVADLCMREDRWWKGAGVGLAAGMKLTPAIFIPYLLLTGRYRAALTATVAFGLTVAVSFAVLPTQARQYWLGGLFLHQQRVGYPDMLPDQSLDGVLSRLAASGNGSVWLAWLVAVAIVGTAGLMLAVIAHNRGLGLLGIVTCAITGLLISPISWDHHWVWIVLLPVAALAVVRKNDAADKTPRAFGAACLVALSALFLDYPIFSGMTVSAHSALDGLIWGTYGNPDHWHGSQLIFGNLYVLAGLTMLCAVAIVVSSYPSSRNPAARALTGVLPAEADRRSHSGQES